MPWVCTGGVAVYDCAGDCIICSDEATAKRIVKQCERHGFDTIAQWRDWQYDCEHNNVAQYLLDDVTCYREWA